MPEKDIQVVHIEWKIKSDLKVFVSMNNNYVTVRQGLKMMIANLSEV